MTWRPATPHWLRREPSTQPMPTRSPLRSPQAKTDITALLKKLVDAQTITQAQADEIVATLDPVGQQVV